MGINDVENAERLRETFARRAKDFDDLQNEMAGRDVGRMNRFVCEDRNPARASGNRRAERAEALTRLQLLMTTNPAYAALYEEVTNLLSEAETLTEAAIEQAEEELRTANEALEDALSRAPRLEDGRRVFRDENGQIWSEDGDLITGVDAESVVWPENALTREDHLRRKEGVDEAQQRLDALRAYQTDVLGAARDRLSDPENPASRGELEDIKREIEKGVSSLLATTLRDEQPSADRATFNSAPKAETMPEV